MIILGIDPGINKTGWAIIKISNSLEYIASGVIKTSANLSVENKLSYIFSNVKNIISSYKPELCSLEEIFINKNPQSSLKLAYARGAIMAAVASDQIKLIEYSARTIKKTIIGNGASDKTQIKFMVKLLFPKVSELNSEDESDALAIAYCGAAHFKSPN